MKHPTGHLPWLWTHFCFRGLWEDEMFARQAVAYARDQRGVELTHKLSAVHVVVKSREKSECWGS